MDRDGSGEINFDELVASTIETSATDATTYRDESYIKHSGMEIYMFLAKLQRHKLLRQYESQQARPDDQFSDFEKFQTLMRISQAAVMPLEMFQNRERAFLLL
eukprot:FR740363.1.p1 GENE.FR740363.1~~FR740363.1.p1  ORF type:complete len:103 (+),score=7.69 FR740363.1:3-311(+)